jgi:hypothetical protein
MARLRNLLAPVTIIGGSTAVSFLVADAFLSIEQYRRTVAADVHGAMNWLAALDPLMVAAGIAVAALIAIVVIAKRFA